MLFMFMLVVEKSKINKLFIKILICLNTFLKMAAAATQCHHIAAAAVHLPCIPPPQLQKILGETLSCILNMKRGITKRTQINSSWTDITASLMPVLQNMKTSDGTECIEKQSANQRIQWFRRPTANFLRLHMLNQSRQCPCIQNLPAQLNQQIYLFPTSSESPQTL